MYIGLFRHLGGQLFFLRDWLRPALQPPPGCVLCGTVLDRLGVWFLGAPRRVCHSLHSGQVCERAATPAECPLTYANQDDRAWWPPIPTPQLRTRSHGGSLEQGRRLVAAFPLGGHYSVEMACFVGEAEVVVVVAWPRHYPAMQWQVLQPPRFEPPRLC